MAPASIGGPTLLPDGLAPGSAFAGLRIDRLLGRGALGAVYLAHRPPAGEPRAVKVLSLQGAGGEPEHEPAFLAEAEAARRLHHPGIVRVFEAGQAQGLGYLVMEALPGRDLSRYTQPARLLPEPVVLDIGARVAEALAHAHRQGVLHRDVKPANVMLHLPTRQVKLTDFGLARLHDAARTRSGVLLGTPAFIAPEVLASGSADARSDLYALAVMLYQLLTARLPHEGDTLGSLLQSIARGEARPLSALRPDLPPALSALLARQLARAPGTREGDGQALAQSLRDIAAGWGAGAGR